MNMIRRIITAAWLVGVCAGADRLAAQPAAATGPAPSSTYFEVVRKRAEDLARQAYKAPEQKLPALVANLGYDDYRKIRFRPDRALWRSDGRRFEVEFFHAGGYFRDPVRINTLQDGRAQEIRFSPDDFDYSDLHLSKPMPPDLFFAGLRILYPVNRPDKMDEIAVFLGASFFRLIGARQTFGTSARALAIDTAEPNGEEFPRFSEFWLEVPGQTANAIRLYALLESPRVAGAYAFSIQPGDATVAIVEASLYFRDKVGKLGLAPLTSMFFFGENRTRCVTDYRPEVHDADGLLLQTAARQWLWRPLRNPPRTFRLSEFSGTAAYGLLQRDRDFDHYQDLEAHYEDRPSYWVVPGPDWPPGHVELVEIPSDKEGNDNIVALWVPDQQPEPQKEMRLGYDVRAFRTSPDLPAGDLLRVRATRLQPGEKSRARTFVDFDGGSPPGGGGRDTVTTKIDLIKARIENLVVQRNDKTDGWRVFFDLISEAGDATARVQLLRGGVARSETWVYPAADN